jgi:hypothetical protein
MKILGQLRHLEVFASHTVCMYLHVFIYYGVPWPLPPELKLRTVIYGTVVPLGIRQLRVDRQPQRSGCVKERSMIKTMKSRGKNTMMAIMATIQLIPYNILKHHLKHRSCGLYDDCP